jgi:hypothetical protein
VSVTLLLICKATIVEAPACKLLPAVERHGRRADHDLVEHVRHGVAIYKISLY